MKRKIPQDYCDLLLGKRDIHHLAKIYDPRPTKYHYRFDNI